MRPNWRDIFESPLIVAILDRGGRLGPPTREEDTRLILAAQAGCTASREELVVRHSPFVVMEVKKMGGYGMEYPDLFQEGMLGLDRAIDKFDPAFDNRFISYAVWWIKQAMLYAVHNTVSTIRVPVSRHKDVAKIKRLVNSGRTVTARDVQRICKTRLDVSQSILDASFRTISLNDPMWIALAESDEIGAQLHGPYNDDFADADEARWAVRMIMDDAGLTDKEKHIVVQRMYHNRTLDDIGAEYGVTRERIRQIEKKAMRRVRLLAKQYDRRCGFTRNDRLSMLSMGG